MNTSEHFTNRPRLAGDLTITRPRQKVVRLTPLGRVTAAVLALGIIFAIAWLLTPERGEQPGEWYSGAALEAQR